MKNIRNTFVTGCLVLLPFFATVHLIAWLIDRIDGAFRFWIPNSLVPINFRGIGFMFALVVIWMVGVLTKNFVGNWIIQWFDHVIKKISIVGSIYSSIKKFLETIFNPKTDQFKEAVLVPFPRSGVYSIGFKTGKPDTALSETFKEPHVSVFVPCTPNPTSGFYLLVPERELVTIKISVQEAFRIIISMGLVTSDHAEVLSKKL